VVALSSVSDGCWVVPVDGQRRDASPAIKELDDRLDGIALADGSKIGSAA